MSKTLGVISGMGPFAAVYFLKRVLEFTPAKKEWEYFRMIADFNVFIPSRTRAILYDEPSPAPEMIKTIDRLQVAGADIIAVPCNSGHGWYNEVSKYIKVPWLNMIEITSNVAIERNINKPLVLSAYVPYVMKLYNKYLDAVYLIEKEQKKLATLIERLKLNENKDKIKTEFLNLITPYKVDGIIIACTELSTLFDKNDNTFGSFQMVDSTNEYAKRCVKECK